jgi:hypothetical protein
MLTLPHTLVAAVIVKLLPEPLLALPLAFISHFLLDFYILHWNPHLYTEFKKKKQISQNSQKVILADGLLALTFCFYILLKYWPDFGIIALFAGAIFLATLPDTVEIPYYFLGLKNRWLSRYVTYQHHHQSNGNFYWGMLTQVILVVLSLLFLIQ